MIKKIKIEYLIITILSLVVFISEKIDLWSYKEFVIFENSINNIYFKEFFTKITELGDSVWYFSISIIIFLLSYFFKNKLLFYKKIKNFSIFLFLSILITGIITQVIKHIIGRPRPNYSNGESFLEFNFFTFDSTFHSFPSGHSSTIFVVSLVLAIITPKIKYFYFICALVVALSRVIVGAHFLSDIIGGAIIAFVGFNISLLIFKKLKISLNFNPINKINNNIFLLSIIIFLILIIFVTVGGSIDIYISNLFYLDNNQFYLQSFDLITILMRKVFLYILIIYLLILPFVSLFLPIKKIYFNYVFTFKDCLLICLTFLFNLVIIVNLLFKGLWGRARPNDIVELGGVESFSYWFEISDACNRNCSFVSGDASVGFSTIMFFFITKNILYLWLALLFGFGLGVIRILEGGHYFSDVLLGGFLIFILCFGEFYLYKKKYLNNEY